MRELQGGGGAGEGLVELAAKSIGVHGISLAVEQQKSLGPLFGSKALTFVFTVSYEVAWPDPLCSVAKKEKLPIALCPISISGGGKV